MDIWLKATLTGRHAVSILIHFLPSSFLHSSSRAGAHASACVRGGVQDEQSGACETEKNDAKTQRCARTRARYARKR